MSNALCKGESRGLWILVFSPPFYLVFAKSICLQDKWPVWEGRWQATQRWYWIDFWNVAELTVWCIRADMNHKNSIKKPLEWLTPEYYLWWLIWLSHYKGTWVPSPPTKLLSIPPWIPQLWLSAFPYLSWRIQNRISPSWATDYGWPTQLYENARVRAL